MSNILQDDVDEVTISLEDILVKSKQVQQQDDADEFDFDISPVPAKSAPEPEKKEVPKQSKPAVTSPEQPAHTPPAVTVSQTSQAGNSQTDNKEKYAVPPTSGAGGDHNGVSQTCLTSWSNMQYRN